MKILLITNSLSGGAGKACRRLYESLTLNGSNVKILHLEGSTDPDTNIVSMYPNVRKLFLKQILNNPKKKITEMYFGSSNTNYRLPYSFHDLEKHTLIEWADVINLHWVPEFLNYVNFFKKVSKPIVWTLHDMLPFSGGFHYELDNKIKNNKIESKIEAIKYESVKDANLSIVAPSKWLLKHSKKSFAFKEKIHTHIFNPLPTKIFKPIDKKTARKALNLPLKGKIIVFSSANINSERKGMKIMIDAINLLVNQDLTLVSIGSGKINNKIKIPYIHLGPFNDDYSISLLYSAADLSLVPSKEDNSPNTIIESFACGCPVIGFKIGGIPELIFSEDFGITVTNYNKKDFALAISKAIGTEYSVDLIRKFIMSKFNYDVVAKSYLKIFNSIYKN